MTDLETIRAMFTRAGIKFTEEPADHLTDNGDVMIEVKDGYEGFVAVSYFDKDGALLRVGAWE